MMSIQTPPLSRSGSSPSSVGLNNRSAPSAAPPTSLSLRSSYNQLLGRDVIKESVGMETGSSATLPKSRHRYAMTSVRSAMGLSDPLASQQARNQAPTRGRGLPTKSSSSSALYSSCSSSSTFSSNNNPKLAKNGANLQRRAESQQQELNKAHTEVKGQEDDFNLTSDWPEFGKDNSQAPAPFRRRTKSFLEYHEKDLGRLDMSGWGIKEKGRGEKNQQASPDKERDTQEEEKQRSKQDVKEEEEKEEEEKVEEGDGEATPTPSLPLLPLIESPPSSPQNYCRPVEYNIQAPCPPQAREEVTTQVQGHPPGLETPPKPPRNSQAPRVVKVEMHPNNENLYLKRPLATPSHQARGEDGIPLLPQAPLGPSDPDGKREGPDVPEPPSEDEDSSWTTLSQETPSPQTPKETADVWSDGDLPPGWREVTDVSEVYFWHIPTGTTQYDRPVAQGNEHTHPNSDSHLDTLRPPNERPSSLVSDSSVEPVPSPSPSSPSSPSDVIVADRGFDNTTYTASELKDYPVYPDPSLKAFEGATLRYASLRLNPAAEFVPVDLNSNSTDPEVQSFPVRSLGWVEMAETDLCEGRSSLAVHHCIRQLSYCRRDIRDSAGVWGEGKGMLLVLDDRTLTLVDPDDHSLLHSQPISSIRVWGVGRDHDR
ncbi:amyloid beta precursor protein binding family B member 2-like isoform X1 [Hypomesus transpacificus]|uniref:amyloid beta precursor protein binding family B member 2-like isoform X1 n=1 Tax=Hypomesus transpacificus TaxID=137520 RepID=UPI001F07373E|nr:amyloid beta precursor protein binding family B member 2-like isoform X1 [Hypomesus transpacificus]